MACGLFVTADGLWLMVMDDGPPSTIAIGHQPLAMSSVSSDSHV
jgi:hypothetical protein